MRRRLSPSLYYAPPGHRGGGNGGPTATPWPSLAAAPTPARSAASSTRRTAASGRRRSSHNVATHAAQPGHRGGNGLTCDGGTEDPARDSGGAPH